mgnify:CR=1 FL=1
MNLASIYASIGPSGVALVFVGCAGLYLALRNLLYLHFVWRDFKRDFLDIEHQEGRCMRDVCDKSDNPLIAIIRDVVKTHGGHSEDIRAEVAYLFHRNFEQVTKGLCWLRLISVVSPLLGLLGTILGMVTSYVGIMQVLNGEMTLGSYMAFSTLSSYFTSPVSELVSLQMSIQQAQISIKRLTEIMDYESEQDETREYTEMEKIDGDIEFKDVSFRYGSRSPALSHVSFTIPYGKKVALVGSSGSGKSTITKLLLKYYEPEEGSISVGGVPLDEYSNASVRRAIAYVPQNVELFSKTIYDNIRISRPEASLDEVKAAAKKADAHEFIRKLPLQYNTYLEEAGNGLSGGEKQRLALARAFLKDANLYILDESTSSLDFGTENTIFDMIYNQLADRSMLIVAHRLSTIRDCDLILVMDHGEIVERGTHEELLAKQGKYYELWSLQQGIFRNKKKAEQPAPAAAAKVVEDEDDGESITY